jgi:pimeloyl-ACP methyl ester carboxylesterase
MSPVRTSLRNSRLNCTPQTLAGDPPQFEAWGAAVIIIFAIMLTETFRWRGDQQVRWSRQGSGPPLVFCHGTPWSSAVWRRISDALRRDLTIYLWDTLGYCASIRKLRGLQAAGRGVASHTRAPRVTTGTGTLIRVPSLPRSRVTG